MAINNNVMGVFVLRREMIHSLPVYFSDEGFRGNSLCNNKSETKINSLFCLFVSCSLFFKCLFGFRPGLLLLLLLFFLLK